MLPYALTDILGRLAQRLLVQDSKKGRIIVQRFKSITVKDKKQMIGYDRKELAKIS